MCLSELIMNLNDISTQLLFTTVQIWSESNDDAKKVSCGTAFIFNYAINDTHEGNKKPPKIIPFLITNYHVVANAARCVVEFFESCDEDLKLGNTVKVELDFNLTEVLLDEKLDLAAIPIGYALNAMQEKGKSAFFRSVDEKLLPTDAQLSDFSAVEDIVFIGYPSGLRDSKNGLPIVRRGITASPIWADFEGKPEFLIDAGVFPGSSGSPVFILNQGSYSTRSGLTIGSRLLFLGIVSQTMLRSEITGDVYLGLGRVVRANEVIGFIRKNVKNNIVGGGS